MQRDSAKASIASLEKTTEVIAHIAEKPQVTVAAAENGAVTVKGGTRVNEVSITKDSTNTHVDYDSAITITAEPEEGATLRALPLAARRLIMILRIPISRVLARRL